MTALDPELDMLWLTHEVFCMAIDLDECFGDADPERHAELLALRGDVARRIVELEMAELA